MQLKHKHTIKSLAKQFRYSSCIRKSHKKVGTN